MFKSKKKLCLLSLAAAILFALNITSNALAEESSIIGLQISPVIQRMELDPSSSYANNITIVNTGDEPLKFEMNISPYQVEDINYAPIYTVTNAYTQIVNWITFDEYDDYLEPGEMSIVHYHINVPKDAPGGGQYAVVFAETKDATGEDQSVRANARAGMIVRAKVAGVTRETGEITKTIIPGFLLAPPISATATFKNTGNVDADARMSIKIEKYFSGEVIYDGTNDQLEKTILPDTTRDLNISWANVPRLGIFKVTLNTEFMGDAEVKTRIVIICPIWFMAIIILIILVIVFRILAKRREDRRTRTNSRNAQGSSGNLNL